MKRQTDEDFMAGTKALRDRGINTSDTSTSGLYSSNAVEMKEKQLTTAKILEEIKKYLDRKELPRLLEVFKEVKSCETIDPVFRKLKNIKEYAKNSNQCSSGRPWRPPARPTGTSQIRCSASSTSGS